MGKSEIQGDLYKGSDVTQSPDGGMGRRRTLQDNIPGDSE